MASRAAAGIARAAASAASSSKLATTVAAVSSSPSSSFTTSSASASSSVPMHRRVVAQFQLRSFDKGVLDMVVKNFCEMVSSTGATVGVPAPLPHKIKRVTVLRSPHVDKASRQQFEQRTYRTVVTAVLPPLLHSDVNQVVTRLASTCPISCYASAKTRTYLLPPAWKPDSFSLQQELETHVNRELKKELIDTYHRARDKPASRAIADLIAHHVRQQARRIDSVTNRAIFAVAGADDAEQELMRARMYEYCVQNESTLHMSPHIMLRARENVNDKKHVVFEWAVDVDNTESDEYRFACDYIFSLHARGFSEQQLQAMFAAAGNGELSQFVEEKIAIDRRAARQKQINEQDKTKLYQHVPDENSIEGGLASYADTESESKERMSLAKERDAREQTIIAFFTPENSPPAFHDSPAVRSNWSKLKEKARVQLLNDGLSESAVERALADMDSDLNKRLELEGGSENVSIAASSSAAESAGLPTEKVSIASSSAATTN